MDNKRSIIFDAFDGDHTGLKKYTDPDTQTQSFDEVADDVYRKILDYESLHDCRFIPVEGGYIFFQLSPKRLVSFALQPKHRTRRGLMKFWGEILHHIGNEFDCILWSKNTRAIRFLTTMGMVVDSETKVNENYSVVRLCQFQQ